MTTIRATCPSCGEVELTAEELTLSVCPSAPRAYYAFWCPACEREIRKPADDHVVTLLMRGGVEPLVWDIPLERLETQDGPALDYDDLLDFALHLGQSDHLAAFATLTAGR